MAEKFFKLNLRNARGEVRVDIPKSVMYTMASRWGDLIYIIPSNRWSTMEEIAQIVWAAEKRNVRNQFNRTRKQIEDGVRELLEASVVAERDET
jgi:hypothetical protein